MASYNLVKKEKKIKKQRQKPVVHFTKWGMGVFFLSLSAVCLFAVITGLIPFLQSFLLGVFGYFSIVLFVILFFVGLALLNKKKYVNSFLYILYIVIAIVSLLSIIDLAIYHGFSGGFGEYLANSYNTKATAGGFIIGLFSAIFRYTMYEVGAYVLCSVAFITSVALIIDYYRYAKNPEKYSAKSEEVKTIVKTHETSAVPAAETIPEKELVVSKPQQYIPKTEEMPMDVKTLLGLNKDIQSSNIDQPKPPVYDKIKNSSYKDLKSYLLTTPEDYTLPPLAVVKKSEMDEKIEQLKQELPIKTKPQKFVHDNVINPNVSLVSPNDYNSLNMPATSQQIDSNLVQSSFGLEEQSIQEQVQEHFVDSDDEIKEIKLETKDANQPQVKAERNFLEINFDGDNKNSTAKEPYNVPDVDMFTTKSVNPLTLENSIDSTKFQLEQVLETFKIPAKVTNVVIGPAISRFELEMPVGISVKKVTQIQDDIALALATKNIRIEAPIPGKSAVGIEMPNEKVAMVGIKEIFTSREFNTASSQLPIALGKDINGNIKICDLANMPHLLIAGATNSGKSVCLNAIIVSLIQRMSPDELRLILIDPKRVEFSMYNNLPHLIMPKVVCEADKAINCLKWAVNEMERRYMLLEELRAKNIAEYNLRPEVVSGKRAKMHYIVIMLDELNNLMTMAKKDVEDCLMSLAQKARAAGIHMVVATQRPSVDVITGTIKANFPSRISFKLPTCTDSKTILDQAGAEKLLGRGDMLFKSIEGIDMVRIQGCYMSGTEIENYVNYIIENNQNYDFDISVEQEIMNMKKQTPSDLLDTAAEGSGVDELFKQAVKFVIENGQASASAIQRRLQVGYPRAGRLLDKMEEAGYISSADGSKPRSIYITMEEWEKIFGND